MTPPRTKKLFISYRSSDAAKVDRIARDLALLKHADGSPRYMPWQDKHNLPPASPNWWDAIVDAIISADMFVFNLSRASLQSEVCRAELDYARQRNRPIIPVVLDGEFNLDEQSGKYNIGCWELVPEWLAERQFLFDTGADFYRQFQTAVEQFERDWPPDIPIRRPLNPDQKSQGQSNHALYDEGCDLAGRLALAEADKRFRPLVVRNDADYKEAAAEWLKWLDMYAELLEIDARPHAARLAFNKKWAIYAALFPNDFMDGIFDPKGFAGRQRVDGEKAEQERLAAEKAKQERIAAEKAERERIAAEKAEQERIAAEKAERERIAAEKAEQERIARQGTRAKPRSIDLLPAPFAWVEIPGGKVKIEEKVYTVAPFEIAKYPVTNAQFAKFMEAGGYGEKRWWTAAGWEQCKLEKWTEPRYWRDTIWYRAEDPVVGVSWFEAVAFCLWLSDITGEKIMLPTEDQWQYAAQGDDGRDYPWGKKWDRARCNNNVDKKGIGKTTPVRQYEGKGDSPFGVVDMAGNVWEWCLTDYDNKTNDVHSSARYRVLRGGSGNINDTDFFRCDLRYRNFPHDGFDDRGFRLALS